MKKFDFIFIWPSAAVIAQSDLLQAYRRPHFSGTLLLFGACALYMLIAELRKINKPPKKYLEPDEEISDFIFSYKRAILWFLISSVFITLAIIFWKIPNWA